MYKTIIRPLFFKIDPEKVHYKALNLLRKSLMFPGAKMYCKSSFQVNHKSLEKDLFGLTFKNPIGLAAGFDKDAKYIEELAQLGFGFIEIGTLTPKGQEGNPKPRLFRVPEDEGLINRMGFNNEGVEAAIERLRNRKTDVIIGGNIGKNKVTPNENALDDYERCFDALFPYVDYFVVNVSSPNTPNLRALQEKEPLMKILSRLVDLRANKGGKKAILLKIAPDLTDEQLNDIIDIVRESGIDGVIATNTTISRADLKTNDTKIEAIGAGGLSGKPVKERSTEVIRYLKQKSNNAFPVIGVGGIYTAQDAIEKLEAGADLLQVYSGFIYEGPSMMAKINKQLINYFEKK